MDQRRYPQDRRTLTATRSWHSWRRGGRCTNYSHLLRLRQREHVPGVLDQHRATCTISRTTPSWSTCTSACSWLDILKLTACSPRQYRGREGGRTWTHRAGDFYAGLEYPPLPPMRVYLRSAYRRKAQHTVRYNDVFCQAYTYDCTTVLFRRNVHAKPACLRAEFDDPRQ